MKIIVPAIGSRGDVQPYIALCLGLQRAGHNVTLATNPTMRALVASFGLKVAPVGPPVDMGVEGAILWEKSGNNMWLGLIRVMRLASKLIEDAFPDLIKLCVDADLVIVSDVTAGAAEAEKLGVPWVSVTLQPSRIPVATPSPSLKQRMVQAVWPVVNGMMVSPINGFRKRVGAPTVKDIGSMMSQRLIMVPISPEVVPCDERWPFYAHTTGYWIADSPEGWAPPQGLLEFLDSGDCPIAISLGAMSLAGGQTHEAARITLEAIRQTGVRAVIQGWDEALAGTTLPKTVYHAPSVPHSWLFERVGAVIHHGGFGTTASTLRAGIPGIVVPHIIDQFYWAERVTKLGTGPAPIPRAKLTVRNLSEAIARAVSDHEIARSAADLGYRIRREPDGVTSAVHLIESICR